MKYKLLVDWDNDGDFADTGEAITTRLLDLAWERGRDFTSSLVPCCKAGALTARVNNNSGDYSSQNASSPLYGLILPGRAVRLDYEPPLGSIYTLHNGVNGETAVTFGSPSAIDNVFTGGGAAELFVRVDGAGEDSLQVFLGKTAWRIGALGINESARTWTLFFRHDFDTTDGEWRIASLMLNRWYRISLSYDKGSAANDPVIYLDGAVQTVTEASTPSGTADDDAAAVLQAGEYVAGSALNGALNDIRLWNDTRTAAEIAANWQTQLTGAEAGLVQYCKLNEGSGTDAADETATANDGTLDAEVEWRTASLWAGYLQTVRATPNPRGVDTAELTAFGPLSRIASESISVAMQTSITTGAAIGEILDAAGWPAGARAIDTGQTTMARYVQRDAGVLNALRILENTESGLVGESKEGNLVFEDRHHRLLPPHTNAVGVISDAIGAQVSYSAPAQNDPYIYIRNLWEVDIPVFSVASLAVLWTLAESGASSPALAPGQSRTFSAFYPTPDVGGDAIGVDAWTTPVASTDYLANSQSDGGGTDLTADIGVAVVKTSNKMAITLTNNGATGAFVTLLQARGTAVVIADPIRVSAEDAASQAAYGIKAHSLGANFIPTSLEGQDWAAFNLAVFKDPFRWSRVTLNGASPSALALLLYLDISARVHFVANSAGSGLGIDGEFFVEHEKHSISAREKIHRAEYTLTPALQSTYWVLGESELGSETVLAY